MAKTEDLVAAGCAGGDGWGDDDPSVFMISADGGLHGEFQVTNGYGPDKVPQVMKVTDIISSDVTMHAHIFLIKWYANHRSLYAVELLNELLPSRTTLEMVTKYYKAGYEAVRKHSKTAYVVISNRLGLSSNESRELLPLASGLNGTVIDFVNKNISAQLGGMGRRMVSQWRYEEGLPDTGKSLIESVWKGNFWAGLMDSQESLEPTLDDQQWLYQALVPNPPFCTSCFTPTMDLFI